MKLLSKASIYGLRALVYIAAENKTEGYVSIKEISEKLDISFHFLTKTLQILTRHDLLESYRGPTGGIALKKPASELYLIDVIKALEGEDFFDKCMLGLPGCGTAAPCPVHDFWKEAKELVQFNFENTSLEDLGNKVKDNDARLVA